VLIKALTKPDLPDSERVDINKSIKELEVRDWALILRAFDEWPFAPEVSSSLIDFFLAFISSHGH
jgi:transcription factor 1